MIIEIPDGLGVIWHQPAISNGVVQLWKKHSISQIAALRIKLLTQASGVLWKKRLEIGQIGMDP